MRCVVPGAAGFIGSHLCEHLLRSGHEVTGVDAFIPYYAPEIKRRNLVGSQGRPGYNFAQLDLRTDSVDAVLAGAEVVFHIAAMPGLAASWTDFELYQSCNVTATQRLLE